MKKDLTQFITGIIFGSTLVFVGATMYISTEYGRMSDHNNCEITIAHKMSNNNL